MKWGDPFAKPMPSGWRKLGAKTPPPPVAMGAWTFHAAPPVFVHANGFRCVFFELGITSGDLLDHARLHVPAVDAATLEGLVATWWGEEQKRRGREGRRNR